MQHAHQKLYLPSKDVVYMNELRFNRITGEWVIIASERAKRKKEIGENKGEKAQIPEWSENCPFCPGNEEQTPPEIFSYTYSETPGSKWKIRVIPNKYPVVSNQYSTSITDGFFKRRNATGLHYVIVESPYHNRDIPDMEHSEIQDVVNAYFETMKKLLEKPEIKSVILFRNHGKDAGTSLIHPHSQAVGFSFVPTHIMDLFNVARCYAHEYGSCLYCDTLKEEIANGERIVYENEEFVALVPFAAKLPYEIHIIPRKHRSHFINTERNALVALADVLGRVLKALRDALGDPSYNLVLHTSPSYLKEVDYYHWYIEIIPRITIPAGLEMGSGITVNISLPENDAIILKEHIS
ncbi:MAG: galactose-1-phosphate uridylyltransferase [Thermoplasmata archaeon]